MPKNLCKTWHYEAEFYYYVITSITTAVDNSDDTCLIKYALLFPTASIFAIFAKKIY